MTRACLSLLVLFAACDGRPPVLPGDGDGTGTVGDGDGDGDGDADASAGFELTGVVCIVSDLRFPDRCDSGDASGLTVRDLGSNASTTTAASGAFRLALPPATRAAIRVSGTGVHPAVIEIGLGASGATNVLVPVANDAGWTAVVTATVGVEPQATATIAAYLVGAGGDPAVGGEVLSPTGATIAPFYDDGGALQWTQTGFAGTAGAALQFGVPTFGDSVTFTALNSGGSVVRNVTVPVVDAATTFVFVDLSE